MRDRERKKACLARFQHVVFILLQQTTVIFLTDENKANMHSGIRTNRFSPL